MSAKPPAAAPAYAFGGPAGSAHLRSEPADFAVDEELGFEPDGEGEHVFVHIEKTAANTSWVAEQIARFADVPRRALGYSGMKDRHAVARQWFSVHLPGREAPDWSTFAAQGVRVLETGRHRRKLRRGAHKSNRFRLRLRALECDRSALEERLKSIAERGVPAYFGAQRYGRGGSNLSGAEAAFRSGRLPRSRERRGFLLSAARSYLFDAVLAARVADESWDSIVAGDVAMLDGTHSVFCVAEADASLAERAAVLDLHPTGPLWGKGELKSTGPVLACELAVAETHSVFARGLENAGLEQQRRALRVRVDALAFSYDADALVIEFRLPPGAYATTVLREALALRDMAAVK